MPACSHDSGWRAVSAVNESRFLRHSTVPTRAFLFRLADRRNFASIPRACTAFLSVLYEFPRTRGRFGKVLRSSHDRPRYPEILRVLERRRGGSARPPLPWRWCPRSIYSPTRAPTAYRTRHRTRVQRFPLFNLYKRISTFTNSTKFHYIFFFESV